jgi:hypothetical protein
MSRSGVPEERDAAHGEVDRVPAPPALAEDLPVLHRGEDMLNLCPQPFVSGQMCGVVVGGQRSAGHGAVAAVGERGGVFGQVDGGFGDHDGGCGCLATPR